MSAASASRIGLPLSQVSATASAGVFSSMRSAILFRIAARSVGEVLPQAGAAACAASSAFSISDSSERATSQNVWPVTGVGFSKYRPSTGAIHWPPMKFWYRDSYDINAPAEPGRAKTVIGSHSFCSLRDKAHSTLQSPQESGSDEAESMGMSMPEGNTAEEALR